MTCGLIPCYTQDDRVCRVLRDIRKAEFAEAYGEISHIVRMLSNEHFARIRFSSLYVVPRRLFKIKFKGLIKW